MAKQIVLGGGCLRFPSQKAAKDHYKGILWFYGLGCRVSDPEHEEQLLLLIENHPEGRCKQARLLTFDSPKCVKHEARNDVEK